MANEGFDRELTELLKLWRWRATDWPSPDFENAVEEIERLRARHGWRTVTQSWQDDPAPHGYCDCRSRNDETWCGLCSRPKHGPITCRDCGGTGSLRDMSCCPTCGGGGKVRASQHVWTGQMAGFTPAETDRSSTGTFDQGGPSELPPHK